ncbi:Mitochondrial inner membrane protease ATP23 [Seminavis robusta]|uniref:Mitochondrial inner membrane protease ATP23 n=1 Tax=Seminavis robusta TaxID=568900 RepID=A0A9N8EXW9_9STRA|nr:Mitochondrial inner membrane protease ATP23 [Seminavis robusta]|eukprot:Sro2401_g326260.1 Mitochondrial inner membrane protease ATP23 (279) ;mRNA; f:4238-5074
MSATASSDTTASSDDNVEQAKLKASCDNYVSNGLTGNRTIQFLIQQLDSMGCSPPEGFIRCTDCGPLKALGAFHLLSEETTASVPTTSVSEATHHTDQPTTTQKSLPAACSSYFMDTLKRIRASSNTDLAAQDAMMETINNSNTKTTETIKTPEIFLCQQHLSSQDQTHRTIIHELIHAVDTCRSKMDPQSNCIHLACTEIRAENLSGECNFKNELFKIGPHSLKQHGQECVKRRAMLSVNAHPRCRERAEEYVDAAMHRCYQDVFPFERHPNEGPSL